MAVMFPFTPSYASQSEASPRLKVSRLGDGYVSRVIDGINPIADKWELEFTNISEADKQAIDAFFRANLGATLEWTPPGEPTRYWAVLSPWRKKPVSYNVWKLSVTFEEVFE